MSINIPSNVDLTDKHEARRWVNDVTAVLNPSVQTLKDVASPSVGAGVRYITGGTSTITNFSDGLIGQEITIIAAHNITITDGTNIFLSGSVNFVMKPTDTLRLIRSTDGNWYETSRSIN